jgi:hypothetical protein
VPDDRKALTRRGGDDYVKASRSREPISACVLQGGVAECKHQFVELREKGDAKPGIALNCEEMACRAIKSTGRTARQPQAPIQAAFLTDVDSGTLLIKVADVQFGSFSAASAVTCDRPP